MKRSLAVTAALVTAAVLIPTAAHAAAPAGRYVALGDSYTSGPLIPDQVDLNCVRSNRNYPSLVAARDRLGSSFADVSCGGATTDDILNAGKGTLGCAVPAQISAVTAAHGPGDGRIGGNDIGFSGIMSATARRRARSPLGTPCKNQYTAGGVDQLQARIAATAPKVAAVLQAVAGPRPTRGSSSSVTRRSCPTPARLLAGGADRLSATCPTCGAWRSRSTRCWPAPPRPTAPTTPTSTPRRSGATPARAAAPVGRGARAGERRRAVPPQRRGGAGHGHRRHRLAVRLHAPA